MAALDDRYDVYDKCIKMGLDPDRVSHQQRAREALMAEFDARYAAAKAAKRSKDAGNQ